MPSLTIILVVLVFATLSVHGKSVYEYRSFDGSRMMEPADRLVSRCQLTCEKKFLIDIRFALRSVGTRCMNIPNCYMCQDFCQMLPQEPDSIAKLMCVNWTCVSFGTASTIEVLEIYRIFIYLPETQTKFQQIFFLQNSR